MSDPLKPTLLERIDRSKQLALWMSPVVLALIAYVYFATTNSNIDPIREKAIVISFGTYADFDGNHPTMNVKTNDGAIRHIASSSRILRSCKIGDEVMLFQRGMNLRVAPEACNLSESAE